MDLYLKMMVEGRLVTEEVSVKMKDRFDIAIENSAEEYVKNSYLGEITDAQLMRPEMRKTQRIEDFKEAMKLPEMQNHLNVAFLSIFTEGSDYIEGEKYKILLADFSKVEGALEVFELATEQTFQEILNIKSSTLDAIDKMASLKYSEKDYSTSLSLFILLTTFAATHPDYWCRMGIVAQRLKEMNLAAEAYEIAYTLDPEMLEPWLFSVECLLLEEQSDKARLNFQKAKEIFAMASNSDPIWKEIIDLTEESLF